MINNNVVCLHDCMQFLINLQFISCNIGDSLACDIIMDIRNFLVWRSSCQLEAGSSATTVIECKSRKSLRLPKEENNCLTVIANIKPKLFPYNISWQQVVVKVKVQHSLLIYPLTAETAQDSAHANHHEAENKTNDLLYL